MLRASISDMEWDDDDVAELRWIDRERQRRRKEPQCSDGLCGASDCKRCHPAGIEDETDDETQQAETD